MVATHNTDTEINLAVYMERLDSYIASQAALNNTLCEGLERMQTEMSAMNLWRHRLYGARAVAFGLGALIVHTSIVMGGFLALANYMRN